MLLHWIAELSDRLVPENVKVVRACVRLPGENRLDTKRWEQIHELEEQLSRDDVGRVSLFRRIHEAAAANYFPAASALQKEMAKRMKERTDLYRLYRENLESA